MEREKERGRKKMLNRETGEQGGLFKKENTDNTRHGGGGKSGRGKNEYCERETVK